MVVKKTDEQKCGEMGSFIHERPITDLSARLVAERASMAILVTGDTLGRGSQEWGESLMKNFFQTLAQKEPLPQYIIFLNQGVFLSCEGSTVLGYLIEMEQRGVKILISDSCPAHYKVKHKLCAGEISTMYNILDKLFLVEKILTI
ncbi:hypothetical protein [Dehalobacterium formicoaceticum]|uniref:hypothetical protein n=1 Tax=Dehalobacterium formicoaceticum TaxID=51515 RepID=UPI0031F64DB2